MIGRMWRGWGRLALVVALLGGLASCYVPDNFVAEIRLGRTGDYAIRYDGDLIWYPLMVDFHAGKMRNDELGEKMKVLARDLARDHSFKQVTPRGIARLSVKYEREGRLAKTDQASFVRRNSPILMIRAAASGAITVSAAQLSTAQAQEAVGAGVDMRGEFRVVTDGVILDHNAGEVRPFGAYRIYIWRMENALSPAPRLVMQRADR